MKHYNRLIVAAVFAAMSTMPVNAESFPSIPGVSFPKFGKSDKKKEEKEKDGETGKMLGAGAGCVAGAGLSYLGVKAAKNFLMREGNTAKQVEQAAIGIAAVGCIIGGKAAIDIIENMDAESKRAQEDAWAQAQAQAGPVAWQGPTETGYTGTVEFVEVEELPSGSKCGTRKDFTKQADVEAESYTRMCQNSAGIYEKVGVVGPVRMLLRSVLMGLAGLGPPSSLCRYR